MQKSLIVFYDLYKGVKNPRSGLKTDTSQMTPIFSHWQGELSEGIAQLFRGQINATRGEKRKSDEVVRF